MAEGSRRASSDKFGRHRRASKWVRGNTDVCCPWLSSLASIFSVPSVCFPGGICQLYFKTGVEASSSLSPSYYFQSCQEPVNHLSGISEPALRSVFFSPAEKPVSAEWRFTFPRGASRGRGEVTGLPAEKPTKTVAWILSFPWARKWNSPCVQKCSYFHGDTFFCIMYWRTLVKLNSIQISIHISVFFF